jgi:hypothetical protein
METDNSLVPPIRSANTDMDAADDVEDMDDMVDGDRQLTTDSDAIDGGLNDSDLGTPRDGEDAEDAAAL